MITLITDFVGEINIPNPTQNIDKINNFITKYEPLCLQGIFGYPLYKAYSDNPTDPRFVDIVSGKEYTNLRGSLVKWNGLKPLLPDYVYYYIMQDNTTWTTGKGTAIASKNSAVDISPALKMNRAWNEFTSSTRDLIAFLLSLPDTYSEFNTDYATAAYCFADFRNEFDF